MKREKILVNRELRWLEFNERVLQSANNRNIPIMERLKYIGIFSSNLDEFYSVRVGSLNQMIQDPENHPAPIGIKPKHLIKQILKRVKVLSDKMESIFKSIIEELKENNIHIINETQVNAEQQQYLEHYFREELRPQLFPIMLDENQKYLYLKHVTIYLAINMYKDHDSENNKNAIIKVPNSTPRYIPLPAEQGERYFIMVDDVIRLFLSEVFNIFEYNSYEAYTIKITRDAEYDLSEEVTKSLYEKLSSSLKQRRIGMPVRVVYDENIPETLLDLLKNRAQLHECDNIIPGGRYHNARDTITFPKVDREELYFPKQPPVDHHSLDLKTSLLDQIQRRDHLLSLPYQRFDYVIDLLREAAIDPTVKSIKMTLYRVADNSSIINALVNAARNGKKIKIFIEVQARFDEKNNLYWTQKLSKEQNITLINGVEGFKVHSKICVITRKNGSLKSRFALVGTGNFNESTARIYSDHILMTSDKRITNEVNKVFSLLESSFNTFQFKHLIISPFYTRKKIIKMIKNEINKANEGHYAEIVVKINNLVDENMIKWLLKAVNSGVKVNLLIRGIFSMDTSSAGEFEDHITAKALIDRYLEHTRILRFHNQGDCLHFIGSCDWMIRNLDKRIEVLTPIYDKNIKQELDFFIEQHLNDNFSSFSLKINNFNEPVLESLNKSKTAVRAQEILYRHFSTLH